MELQHDTPAWQDQADYAIGARITEANWKDKYVSEQLAAQDLKNGTFMVCCIPFALFDLCLGDIVAVDKDINVKNVVTKGEYWGFRIATSSISQQEALLNVVGKIDNIYHEHFSEKLFAIAVQGSDGAQKIADNLRAAQEKSQIIQYETITS